MSKELIRYEPDYAVSPGEILEERLQVNNIKKSEFAKRSGISLKTLTQIIQGKYSLTAETAIKLERVTGVSANTWNNLESAYRLHKAKQEEIERLNNMSERTKVFPLKELIKRGLIQRYKDMAEASEQILRFFSVATYEAWDKKYGGLGAHFRHSPSFKSTPECLASWLRIGEIHAETIDVKPYNKKSFISALNEIRGLTRSIHGECESKIKQLCSNAGVVAAIIPELPNIHLSGATRWLTNDKALLMLSLRYKSNDHFWFTFFHEAAHILFHGKGQSFLDDNDRDNNNKEENEANEFAANILIPPAEYDKFKKRGIFTRPSIVDFAKEINIHSGIVVGRLQHDKLIEHDQFHRLKEPFKFMGATETSNCPYMLTPENASDTLRTAANK
ncbi:addiction module antidote protein, HigA family [Candidatus Magnetoovum chiemensis]|nr:addiction module antidote protein, HigA family [Candidatus Magnetoovum chiemensis]